MVTCCCRNSIRKKIKEAELKLDATKRSELLSGGATGMDTVV